MKTIVCSVFAALYAFNVNSLEIVTPTIPGLITPDGSGPYQLMVREAVRRISISDEIKEVYYPKRRAVNLFINNKYPCMYGYSGLLAGFSATARIKSSFPLGVAKQYILTRKGTPTLSHKSQLMGLTVSGMLGESEQESLSAGIDYRYIPTVDQNLGMLEKGHVDAVLAFMPDISIFSERTNYDKAHPISISYDLIICHDTAAGAAFVADISKGLESMFRDGTTKKILGDMYLDYDPKELLGRN